MNIQSQPFGNERKYPPKNFRSIISSGNRMNAIREVAERYSGIKNFSVTGKPGETFKTNDGRIVDLEHDQYSISFDYDIDLSDFWKEVDQIAPVKDPLLEMVKELNRKLKEGTLEEGEAEHLTYLINERIKTESEKGRKYDV